VNFVELEDPAIWSSIAAEQTRQAEGLEMIASENFTSPAVMQAVGSVLTNKYAEGYPGRRYYGGCEYVDTVEDLARDRAKQLFNAEHANVQPHSGSQANSAVYLAAIKPGDTVLAFDLSHGGHLTHGMRLNSSGILYRFVHYGVRQNDHLLDFDQIVRLAREHKPKLIVAGASAYPREIPHERFAEIANEVGAKLLVDMAHYAGLVAAGVHNSPVPYADFVTSTTHKTLRGDNHLMLVDVTPLGLGGKLAEEALDRCGITCNKNMIPYDERKPVDPSGIRLGTPALTTRGMGADEMEQVATWILRVLKSPEDAQVIESTRREVADLAEQYPVTAAQLDQVVTG